MQHCETQTNVIRRSARLAVAALAPMLLAASASAAVLYDANVGRRFAPGDADPLFYQVGPDSGANHILIDDVPINYTGFVNPQVKVSRVSFDLSRNASAPAVTV